MTSPQIFESPVVLQERATHIERLVPAVRRSVLQERAILARTVGQRIHWLRIEADQVLSAASEVSPCKRGCSHCCRIGVLASKAEAQYIAREIGWPLGHPAEMINLDGHGDLDAQVFERAAGRFLGVPCPFLKNDACSIYRHRPLACRHHISLANDDAGCRLEDGKVKDVAYLNRSDAKVAAVIAMGQHAAYADLREWFPRQP